jgi:7-alpha-hydroxysteroid dehydrogenase
MGAGAKVMIGDLNGEKAADTVSDIARETGSGCRGMKCDVTSLDDVNAMVKATADAFGGISTLINNVGWGASPILRRSPKRNSSSPTS